MSVHTDHAPQVVTVDRFSDEFLMQALAEWTKDIRASDTVRDDRLIHGPEHDLDESGAVMLVEAWRRGLLDRFFIP